ncbi:MAG: cobyric acid synthase [Thermodesulfobacteriota bacterium]
MSSRASNKARCLAVLGTGSDVGKSIVATALCRILADRGVRVCPFKAQNMSNNSGVTPEGLEMGRAQIVQAEAARIPPHVDMNPVLLKPVTDLGSQVVVLGRARETMSASDYWRTKADLSGEAKRALDRLRREYECVILEGAGSCAEVNLMARDMVNLNMARHAGAPAVLVADIHRGGVFAQIVGTLDCLSPSRRERIAGFVVNRFRGDLSLFAPGVRWIERKTRKPVFGLLPHKPDLIIESEDSVAIESPPAPPPGKVPAPSVGIIRLPHISNFTDFDALARVEGLHVFFLEKPQNLSPFRAVILPGSKSTRHDLDWLVRTGWKEALLRFQEGGGHVLGICGGFQMLGEAVEDPQGLEGLPGASTGLGLLPVWTRLCAPKTTTLTRFSLKGQEGRGYEIHMGRTELCGGDAWLEVLSRNQEPVSGRDGCVSGSGRVTGTYIHGLFDSPGILSAWLEGLGLENLPVPALGGPEARDRQYDLLAEHFTQHVDVEAILRAMEKGAGK